MKRSKKIMSLVLALTMATSVFTIVPLSVNAAETNANDKGPLDSSESTSNLHYRVLEDGTAEITGCSDPTGNIVIPESIDGLTVTSIGKEAFYGYSDIKSVRLPETLTNISSTAFADCKGLASIVIPASVTSIGEDAFSGCSGISGIKVEEGNSVYDSRSECCAIIETATNTLITGCKATVIPNTVTRIGDSAFANCTDLTVLNIPDSVNTIGSHAFAGCKNLSTINIPASVYCIEKYAFMGCDSLNTITVDPANGVYDSRDNCNAIIDTDTNTLVVGCADTTIPDTVTEIGPAAFQDCQSLTNITIPDSVTTIGKSAFLDCTALQSIAIPDSVTDIRESAFDGCRSLQTVDLGNSVQTIGNDAFLGCHALQYVVIPDSVTVIGQEAFQCCTNLSCVVIGSSVKIIDENAFFSCTNLTKVIIPETVDYIKDYAFGYYNTPTQTNLKVDGFTIFGQEGTAAHRYADNNGFSFFDLTGMT